MSAATDVLLTRCVYAGDQPEAPGKGQGCGSRQQHCRGTGGKLADQTGQATVSNSSQPWDTGGPGSDSNATHRSARLRSLLSLASLSWVTTMLRAYA